MLIIRSVTNDILIMLDETKTKFYTRDEVAKHATERDCWMIIDDDVYDMTKFLHHHPGGFIEVFQCAGDDATYEFMNVGHSREASKIKDRYKIGKLQNELIEKVDKTILL